MNVTKQCARCGEQRSIDEYNFSNKPKNARKNLCRPCEKAKNKESYLQNRESRIESTKEWRRNNPAKFQQYQQQYNKEKYGRKNSTNE